MKKILTVLAISFSALIASSLSTAAPQFDHDHPRYGNEPRGRDFRDSDDDDQQDRRRMREERGVKRLQQHKWQQGYVMPQHYRGKDHNLPKPNRNQQWYKINNDYILVDADSNNILRIMGL